MPPLGMVVDEVDFSELVIVLREATEETSAVTINYGNFINTFVEFLIISFVIFIVVKQINKLKRKEEKKPTQPKEETILLREIRDSLKEKK
jgi:large conductance mechanosensitive channel